MTSLIKNSFSGLLQHIVLACVTFVAIPIILKHFGPLQYGYFAQATVLTSINSLANLGLGQALTRFVASSEDKADRMEEFMVTFFVLLLVVLILLFSKLPVIGFLQNILFGESNSKSLELLNCVYYSTCILILGQSLKGLIDGCGFMYITNYIEMIYRIIYWISIILSVQYFGTLSSIGYAILFSTIIWFFGLVLMSSRDFTRVGYGFVKLRFAQKLKRQLLFGSSIYLSGIFSFGFEPLMRVIIANRYGLELAGIYDIALKIKDQIWGALRKLLLPLYPHFSGLYITDGINQLISIEKTLNVIIGMLSIVVLGVFPSLIPLWLPQLDQSSIIFIVYITLNYLLLSGSVIPYYLFLMTSKPGLLVYVQILMSSIATLLLIYSPVEDPKSAVIFAVFITLAASFLYFILLRLGSFQIHEQINILVFRPVYVLTVVYIIVFFGIHLIPSTAILVGILFALCFGWIYRLKFKELYFFGVKKMSS